MRLGGPPTRTRWGGYHLARPGGPPGAERRLVPAKSNLKPQTSKPCDGTKPENPDETSPYQGPGTPSAWAVLTMHSQRSSSTGFTPHELSHGGRPAWFFKTPFPEDFKSPFGDWLEHKQSMANQAGTNLRHIRDRELSELRITYGGRPVSRLVTLSWCTIHAYPPGHVTLSRTVLLRHIVSSG